MSESVILPSIEMLGARLGIGMWAMRGNQLLDSVTRWHHGSQICFLQLLFS